MKIISNQELSTLCQNTIILQANKVYLRADNIIVKLILDRGLISSATLFPHARRIQKNAMQLTEKNIATIEVQDIFYCPERKVSVVLYAGLAGTDCRVKVAESDLSLLTNLVSYVASLHNKGIFFWDLHLGNILYQENKQFALIDIATVKIKSKPLSIIKRARNLSHLMAYKFDHQTFLNYGLDKFRDLYLADANLTGLRKKLFLWYLNKRIQKKLTAYSQNNLNNM